MCPFGMLLPWPLFAAILLFLIPQPMIFTRVMDRRIRKADEKKLNANRFVVNEACVALIALIAYGARGLA